MHPRGFRARVTPERRGALAHAGLVLAGYVAVVVALTWPLAAHVTTHLVHTAGPVDADIHYLGWALAWQSHALATDPLHFAEANIYAPAPHALFYGNPGFALVPFFAPVFWATGDPTLAYNLTFITNVALTATALHLVTAWWTGSHWAGIAAAFTYLTANGGPPLAGFLPVYAAFSAMPLVIALVSRPVLTVRSALVLGGLIAYQCLTDVVYVASPLLLGVGIVALGMLFDRGSWSKLRRVAMALVLALCVLAPFYAAYVVVRRSNEGLGAQTVWDPFGTTHLPYIFAHRWLPPRGPLELDALAFLPVALGLVALLVGRSGATARERAGWRHAGLVFVVGWLLAWGIPRHHREIRELVAASFARDMTRLGFGGLIGAALLAGLGFAACSRALAAGLPERWRRVAVATLLVAFLATRFAHAMFLPGRFPINPAPPPRGPENAILRAGHGPVLFLPLREETVRIKWEAIEMYRGISHFRPMLNGYAGYQPAGFAERMELATRLPDADALATLRRETGLATIVVTASMLPNRTLSPWRAFAAAARSGLRVAYDDGQVLVLEVTPGS